MLFTTKQSAAKEAARLAGSLGVCMVVRVTDPVGSTFWIDPLHELSDDAHGIIESYWPDGTTGTERFYAKHE